MWPLSCCSVAWQRVMVTASREQVWSTARLGAVRVTGQWTVCNMAMVGPTVQLISNARNPGCGSALQSVSTTCLKQLLLALSMFCLLSISQVS